MRTSCRMGKRVGFVTMILLVLSMLAMAPAAQSAIVFFDDFEDGDHDGWVTGTTGGTGTIDVVDHNQSMMAHIYHQGSYQHSLSRDFSYAPTNTLAFDMHAVAVYGGRSTNGQAGVMVSFLDSFNQTLGYTRLINTTDPDSLGAYDVSIDNVQHHYENSFLEYLTLAGLDASSPIDTVSLTFLASGQSYYDFNHSIANLWFDNVTVDAVPLPPAALLLGSGLIGLVSILRRKS